MSGTPPGERHEAMREESSRAGRVDDVVRTCVGCRERVDVTTLVRLVAVQEASTTVVTPDPRRTMPGRGAHLHPEARCLELARRRKAFGRALRVEGPLDLGLLDALVAQDTD